MRTPHAALVVALVIWLPAARTRACKPARFLGAMRAADLASPGNASAVAAAFFDACDDPRRWNDYDVRKYLAANWHSGAPNGAQCVRLSRVGAFDADGGKAFCDVAELFAPRACHVVSVGSRGEVSFETEVHRLAPHCAIDVMDGTLGTKARAAMPPFVNFTALNFDSRTWERYAGRHVSALKIDCEGCEFAGLPSWLANVCTDQIQIEVHGCELGANMRRINDLQLGDATRSAAYVRARRVHELMVAMHGEYDVFHAEFAIAYGDGTCAEYALRRRRPCSAITAV